MAGAEKAIPRQEGAENHPEPISEGGTGDGDVSQEVLEALVRVVNDCWAKGYEILGPVTTTAGVVIMGVSVAEMLAGTAIRAAVLYTQKGPGLWMLAAMWGTVFQVFTMLTQWALEYRELQGRAISHHVLSRVGRCGSSCRWGRLHSFQLSQDQQWEKYRSGSATPAVQRGSVPQKLFFGYTAENSHHLKA